MPLRTIASLIILTANIAFCQNQDFVSGTLSSSGLNENKIATLLDSIERGLFPNRHSLLIFKDNKLVLEKYFKGKDEQWGDNLGIVQHNATTLHDMRSVSKSIVSACIGIAIANGEIKSVDEKIFDFFNEYQQYRNEGRENLTIKHFLTMSSGIKWNEQVPYNNPEKDGITTVALQKFWRVLLRKRQERIYMLLQKNSCLHHWVLQNHTGLCFLEQRRLLLHRDLD